MERKAGMFALDKLLYPDLDWPKMDTAFTTEAPMTRPCGAKNFSLIKNLEHWSLWAITVSLILESKASILLSKGPYDALGKVFSLTQLI